MRRFRRWGVIALACLGGLMLVATVTPIASWWAVRLASPWEDSRGDTLIVLSGSGGSGIIGYGTYLRCEYAVFAWREGGFRRILVTGGNKTGEPAAVSMKMFLMAEGIPEAAILVEPRALSTRENALFSRDLLQGTGGTVVLLTSDYHTYRATHTFRKVGLNVLPRPVPDVTKRSTRWVERWPAFLEVSVESVKILYYQARGWI